MLSTAPEAHTNAAVRPMLDLATAHLPARLGTDGLETADGVTAYPLPHGWLLYVPDRPQDHTDDGVPPEVLTVQVYARRHGCDFVLFDCDGPYNPDLPSWDW